jgi:hypothetical protein
MVEKSTMIMGEEPSPEEIAELDNLKIQIVEQLRGADVKFPIRNKDELARIYPKGTTISCTYKGKRISIHDLIPLIDDRVFPLENAGDTATALVSSCQLMK